MISVPRSLQMMLSAIVELIVPLVRLMALPTDWTIVLPMIWWPRPIARSMPAPVLL